MRRLARLWRRSIQFRVVVSTVALATVFVSATTWAVAVDVIESVDSSRRTSAVQQARLALAEAQAELDDPNAVDRAGQDQVLQDMVDSVSKLPGGPYDLIVE